MTDAASTPITTPAAPAAPAAPSTQEPDRYGAWHTGQDGVRYPPEPWYLGGSLLVSTFFLPTSKVPGEVLRTVRECGVHPISAGGRVAVGVAFAQYTPGGVLAYDELLTAVLGRRGPRLRTVIPQIWVDSEQSRSGGRELWSIPKGLGTFMRAARGAETSVRMELGDRHVASVTARRGRKVLPGAPRIPLVTAQNLEGRHVVSRNYIASDVRPLRAQWSFASDGPLGYLAGATPSISVGLTDGSIVFGAAVNRSA